MNKRIVIALLLFIYAFSLYSYNLPQSFHFDTDFARDASDILDISRGDVRLIGPKSSFGGLYSPPYYYYLLVPVFLTVKNNIDGFLYFNAAFFATTATLFFYFASKKSSLAASILSSLVIILAPIFLFAARNPGNFTSYLSFLLFFLTLIIFRLPKTNSKLFVLGLFGGIIMTFDYVALFLLPFICIYLFYVFKEYRKVLVFICGFLIALTPLLLFEMTHGFIMFKNTFIHGSYLSFLKNANLPGSTSLIQKSLFERFIFIAEEIGRQTGIPFYILLLIGAGSQIVQKKRENVLVLTCLAFASFIVLASILSFQYAQHYVYPVSLFLLFSLVTLLLKRKQLVLLLVILAVQITSFSKSPYAPSSRPYHRLESVVNTVIEKKLLTKKDRFNIIQVRPDTAIAASGHEYRYFFKEAGFEPNSVFDYKSADKLLIFSEDPKFDIKKLDNWEYREFGSKEIENRIIQGGITIYLIRKPGVVI